MPLSYRTAAVVLLTGVCLRAQLTIENPRHLDVPVAQAQTLFLNINRALESEFQSRGLLENKFRVRLVLGEPVERFAIDDALGNASVYLERWDEGKFAVSTTRLAMQHLLPPDKLKKVLEEAVRRTRQEAPISAAQLRQQGAPAVAPPSDHSGSDACVASGVRGGDCMTIRRPTPMSVQ